MYVQHETADYLTVAEKCEKRINALCIMHSIGEVHSYTLVSVKHVQVGHMKRQIIWMFVTEGLY